MRKKGVVASIVLVIFVIATYIIGFPALLKYQKAREDKQRVAHVQFLVNEMRKGNLTLADQVVGYSHQYDSLRNGTSQVRVSFGKDALENSVAIALMEAEARHYAKPLLDPARPKEGWKILMPDVRRAYFYAVFTGGPERYGLTKEKLEGLLMLGAAELGEGFSKDNGTNIPMEPFIMDRPLYVIMTTKGPVIPPGGIDGMTQEVLWLINQLRVPRG